MAVLESGFLPSLRVESATADRASGIGGSDAAAILGISPWTTRLDVWMEKVNHPMFSRRLTPNMRWGTLLEPVIAGEYARFQHVELIESPGRLLHPNGIQWANVDRFVVDMAGALVGLLEVKTAGDEEDWQDGVPVYYIPQVQQYLAVTELPWCDVAVLFRGSDLRTWRVEANLEYQLDLEAEVLRFWREFVIPRRTPDDAPIEVRYPAPVRQERLSVEPGSDLDLQMRTLLEVRRRIKKLQGDEAALLEQIKPVVAEYEGADAPGWRLHYRQSKPPVKVGWEQIAVTLWNTLAVVRRFVTDPHPDLAPHLDRNEWNILQSMYSMKGRASRPFDLDELKEDK